MIDHTGLDVSDYQKSKAFYSEALKPLGYSVIMEIPREYTGGAGVAGFGEKGKPDFWVHEGTPQTPKVHIAFRAESRALVGPRPHYHENYYGAFVLDPDGHNIEAVCHRPE